MHCRQKAPARRIGERPLPQFAHALGVPDERVAPAIAEVPYVLTFEGHSILPELGACAAERNACSAPPRPLGDATLCYNFCAMFHNAQPCSRARLRRSLAANA